MGSHGLDVLVVGADPRPETFLRRLFVGLGQRGFRLTLATSARWPRPASSGEGLRLLRLSRRPVALRRALLRRAASRFDLLYFPWNGAAVAHLELLRDGPPAVISCRGSQIQVAPHDPERRALRQGLPESFARAAAVHCVSAAILREAERYGLDPAKAVVIRPAVDPDEFSPATRAGEEDGPLRLITVGSLHWRKGLEYLLVALRRALDAGVRARLEIVGDGPERDRLLFTIHDLGLQQQVQLAGATPPEGVRDRLQAADLFILASLSEGISNAALEAMACGLPVVVTDVGGMREAVTHGTEGLLIPARDPEAISAALRELAERPGLRRRMGEAGRERVRAEFALADQLDRFAALFARVAT